MKKVSIIIPVYNTEKYLDRCLQSVVNQTYGNLEAIVVDDGSTDASLDICQAWAGRDARIRVLHQENGGLSSARNLGLQAAEGEYLTFLDSDDCMAADKLQVMIEAMEKYRADMCGCDVLAFREGEEPWKTQEASEGQETSCQAPVVKERREAVWLFAEPFTGPVTWVWNKVYTRQLAENIFFDTDREIVEDTIYNAEIMCRLGRMVWVPRKLQYYFQRSGSVMNTGRPEVYTMQGKALLRAYELLHTTGEPDFQRAHLCSCLNKLALLETQAHFDDLKGTAEELGKMYSRLYRAGKGERTGGMEKCKAWCFLYGRPFFHLLKRKWYQQEKRRKTL